MELTHDFTVPADVETTWATFMDLQRVGSCFPGATVTSVTEDGFAGTVKIKLGPIALVYAGSGGFLDRDDSARRAVIEAKGKDKRGNGTAGATVTIQLAPSGSGTRVDVATELAITGKPAQFGRGVMQDVSDKLLGQFVACIESQLRAAEPPVDEVEGGQVVEDATAVEEGGVADVGPPGATVKASEAPAPRATPATDDSIDLGSTVLPVMLRTYAPHLLAALGGGVIGWLIGRCRRR